MTSVARRPTSARPDSLSPGPDQARVQNKERILLCLTRLNEKATHHAAVQELGVIVNALDVDSTQVLINGICTVAGSWEPKPWAKREYIRGLGQLVNPACPAREIVLEAYLPRVIGYLKRHMQEADSTVRDACVEAVAAIAWAQHEDLGGPLPGNSTSSVVRLLFECLAEQKRESQVAASQALLQVADVLAPLDRDHVKLLLKLLRSVTFHAVPQLLAAIASTCPDTCQPLGLLKEGPTAWLPSLKTLVGQPAGAGSAGTGVLGCLGSDQWPIRKAAADTLRAAALLLGPQLEPDGSWDARNPASLVGRCQAALDAAKYDKVAEARNVIKSAGSIISELQQFGSGGGSGGAWEQQAAELVAAAAASAAFISPAAGALRGSMAVSPRGSRVSPFKSGSTGRGHTQTSPASIRASRALDSGVSEFFKRASAQQGDCLVLESRRSRPPVSPPPGAGPDEDAPHSSVAGNLEGAFAAAEPGDQLSPPRSQASSKRSTAEFVQPMGSVVGSRRATAEQPAPANGPASKRSTAEHTGPPPPRQQQPSPDVLQEEPDNLGGSCTLGAVPEAAAAAAATAELGQLQLEAAPAAGAAAQAVAAAQQPEPEQLQVRPVRVSDGGLRMDLMDEEQPAGSRRGTRGSMGGRVPCWTPGVEEPGSTSCARRASLAEVAPPLRGSAAPSRRSTKGSQAAATVEAAAAAVAAAPGSPPDGRRGTRGNQQAAAATTAPDAGAANPAVSVSRCEWEATQQQLQQLQQRAEAMAAALQQLSQSSSATIGALQERVAGLERQLAARPAEQRGSPVAAPARSSSHGGGASRSADFGRRMTPGSLAVRLSDGGLRDSGGSPVGGPHSPVVDLEAAFCVALRAERGDMHLLRLIQRTGPVWAQLTQDTGLALLAAFVRSVQEGVMLHHILPWLWRLADEDRATLDVPPATRRALLAALLNCPAAEDVQVHEKVQLLINTLASVWDMSAADD